MIIFLCRLESLLQYRKPSMGLSSHAFRLPVAINASLSSTCTDSAFSSKRLPVSSLQPTSDTLDNKPPRQVAVLVFCVRVAKR
jgi:hypothetical protein